MPHAVTMSNKLYIIINIFALVNFSFSESKVLIVVLDGFRYDYFKYYKTPNLDFISKNGVYCPNGMKPSFPTKTVPNLYTLATGFYPGHHEIINNKFYDPQRRLIFDPFNKPFSALNSYWWSKEPIFVTAGKQGKNSFLVASMKFAYKDERIRPLFIENKCNSSSPYEAKANVALDLLSQHDYDVGAIYFNQGDKAAHKVGAFHPKVEAVVEEMDSAIGFLITELKRRTMSDTTNVIVVSDHGMTTLKSPHESSIIGLEDYVDFESEVEATSFFDVIALIFPKPGKENIVYQKLKDKNKNMDVYRKKDLPDRFHYGNSARIPEIVLVPKEGYIIQKEAKFDSNTLVGVHGYDNEVPSMKAIFYAVGPAFKPSSTIDTFENVNIYELVCKLLNIKPSPNDGNINVFKDILRH